MQRWALIILAALPAVLEVASRSVQAQASPAPVEIERRTPTTTGLATRSTTSTTTPVSIPPGVTIQTFAIDPTPTRITLKAKNAPADRIFREACNQAGAGFRTQFDSMWASGAPTVDSIDLHEEPFWSALAEVCRRTGTRLGDDFSYVQFPDAVTIAQGRDTSPTSSDGPLLLRVTRIERRATVVYGTPRAAEAVLLSVQARAEPRLRPHALMGAIRIEQAVDEGGVSLLGSRPQPFRFSPTPVLVGPSETLSLEHPAGAGRRIAVLRGGVDLYVPRRVTTVEWADPLAARAPVVVPVEGATLTMKIRPGTGGGNVSVEVELTRGEGMDEERWADMAASLHGGMTARVALLGPKGLTGSTSRSGSSSGAKVRTRVEFTPYAANPPDRLQLELRTDFETIPTTFEFKDIPLP